MLSKLNDYYKSLDAISLTNNDLDVKRDNLKSIIDSYHTQTQAISIDENLLKQNKEMATMLTTTVGSLKTATASWVLNLKDIMEKEKFRSDLENYFIVIIFGKVKAGKSSLGNFIAQNRLSSQDIDFFKYDEAGNEEPIKQLQEIDDEEGFATANMECTVEIQGFKLSGMAWVDTPGLGSMVEENGNLAREYIQSADYVIYPTNSTSPLQQDEKEQLRELFEQNKKVTICITKSDDIDLDECECVSVNGFEYALKNGCTNCNKGAVKVLINKTESNRSQQAKWVKSDMDEILGSKENALLGDVISMSVHTAKHGLKNDDREMFEDSNIVNFYELMTDVVKNKAKTLKENTPYDGLVSFVDNSILGSSKSENSLSIQSLKESTKKFESEIQDGIEKFNDLQKNLDSDITVHVDSVIAQHAGSLTSSSKAKSDFGFMFGSMSNSGTNVSIFDAIDKELHKTISTIVDENISEILKNFSTSFDNLTTALSSADNFNIEDKYETVTVRYVDNSWYNPGGVWGNEYSSESEKVHVGDNKQEVIANFKANRLESYKGVAKENYKSIQEQFFTPLLSISKEINSNINSLESSVIRFKNNLK